MPAPRQRSGGRSSADLRGPEAVGTGESTRQSSALTFTSRPQPTTSGMTPSGTSSPLHNVANSAATFRWAQLSNIEETLQRLKEKESQGRELLSDADGIQLALREEVGLLLPDVLWT
jgi:hypothetical protein